MSFDEFYYLTPRSFFNAVNGQRKKEDVYSKERWIMTREIMFSAMKPYLPEGTEKTDILVFQWEQKQLQKDKEIKALTLVEDIEKMNAFWERQDAVKKS
ncbi:hypothetical protein [Flavobacterium sp. FlaQc-28]|uniref:hypothetical protein n=1 Tax=Flavobacterium sp. FlaQc-28 TaxID=3374178 RepID=UPI0037568561